jgi:hypothetical protein
MKKISLFLVLLGFMLTATSIRVLAQVGINTDNSTPDPSSILDLKSTSKGVLVPRMTLVERDAIVSPADGLMIYQTDQTPGFYYYNGSSWAAMGASATVTPHYIGELFGGGIVFWVDNSGQHGLIASLVDLSTSAQWSPEYSVTGATSTWNGTANTATIVGISPAAQLCDSYTNSGLYGTGIFSDWYLPSIDQLGLVYHSRYILNKNIEGVAAANILAYQSYWSSTENTSNFAWTYSFDYGFADGAFDKYATGWVRAIRTF